MKRELISDEIYRKVIFGLVVEVVEVVAVAGVVAKDSKDGAIVFDVECRLLWNG